MYSSKSFIWKVGDEDKGKYRLHQDFKSMYMCSWIPISCLHGQMNSMKVNCRTELSDSSTATVAAQQENTPEISSTSSLFEWECLKLQYSAFSKLGSFYVHAKFNIYSDYLHGNNFNSLPNPFIFIKIR